MGQLLSTEKIDKRKAAELKVLNDDFIEAEIVLKNLQLAQERAVKLSERRELFTWEFLGVSTMAIIVLVAGAVSKRKDFAIPLAPLVMVLGYRYDTAFGTNHELVRDKAEEMLRRKDERIKVVGGPITLNEVDAYRQRHFQ
ncbi:hypothetical protein GCK32_011794 [Trichostrongylus colubriformis]|uniref:Uncharacterized protein n=1 Tax=Trichostrongylus colubriformis TaxID=6319 RepID=A0AAN8IY84_TRICO